MTPISPRFFPKKRSKAFVRSRSQTLRTRLHLEILEDRLALSATNVDISDLDYQQWREYEFALDQIAVTETSVDFAEGGNDVQIANAAANQLIGLDRVFAEYPYRGAGYSVAVIDTGIDYNHPAFSGRYIAGYDFANDDADPYDDNGHGTHVAGLIGSSNATYVGVAPQINLIALKVLSATGSGSFGDVEDALNWVIQNQSRYNIVAVNMSLGTGNYTTNPFTFLENEFSTLLSQGVFVAAAAGNGYYSAGSTQGLGFPASSPQTVSVGAVWSGNFGAVSWADGGRDFSTAADRVTAFTQRSSQLDIMSPGALLTNAKAGGGWVTMAGTSMATPVTAGAAVIIHQALDATGQGHLANQDYILSIMQSTGARIYDGDDENDNVNNSGRYYQRLDLAAALDSIGGNFNSAPVLQPISNRTMQPGQDTLSVQLNASDADGDALTFSAFVAVDDDTVYQLDQLYGFYQHPQQPDYAYNLYGHQEKWLTSDAGRWFAILPNGELRNSAGTKTFTDPSKIAAFLDPIFYEDPSLLIDVAKPSASQISTRFVGNTLIIDPPNGFVTGFRVAVTVSDGISSASQAFSVSIRNTAPVLQPINDQVMSRSQDTLSIALNASDADGDALTFEVNVTTDAEVAYDLDQQYGFFRHAQQPDYAYNIYGFQEKWLTSDAGRWFAILPNGELRHSAGSATFTDPSKVAAKFDVSYYENPALLINVARPQANQIGVSISNDTLTINPPNGFAGGFQVEVSVSDGIRSASQSFAVAVRNSAPVLQPISDQVISNTQDSISVFLNASDADGDALSYTVEVHTDEQIAYQLDQQYGFYRHPQQPDYAYNVYGFQEKWLTSDAGKWFAIMPNGEIRHSAGTRTFSDPSVVAKLDPRYYENPALLINVARPPSNQVETRITGNTLVIDPANGFSNSFRVAVTVSDGATTTSRSFAVTFRDDGGGTAPTLSPIADRNASFGQTTLVVPLTVSDADATITAHLAGSDNQIWNIDQQFGFEFAGSYYQNYLGLNEKWLLGANNAWYIIEPNGELRAWNSNTANTLAAAPVLTLPTAFYANPELLWNASASFQLNYSIEDGDLVLDLPDGFMGTFTVTVSASNGSASASRSFDVTVS